MENINVNLNKLGDGALQQRFESAVERVTKNILDPNTSLKKRSIVLTLDLIPDKHREKIELEMQVKEKLQPQEFVYADIVVGGDVDGYVEASELLSDAPGQMRFNVENANDPRLETDIGEDVEKIENPEKKVDENGELINFRKKG